MDSNRGFGCFKKPGRQFALCRPIAMHRDASGRCADSADWLCPSSWITAPPPPPPRPSGRPPAQLSKAGVLASAVAGAAGPGVATTRAHAAAAPPPDSKPTDLRGGEHKEDRARAGGAAHPHERSDEDDYTLYRHPSGGTPISRSEDEHDLAWLAGAITLGVILVCALALALALVVMRGRAQREEVQRESEHTPAPTPSLRPRNVHSRASVVSRSEQLIPPCSHSDLCVHAASPNAVPPLGVRPLGRCVRSGYVFRARI